MSSALPKSLLGGAPDRTSFALIDPSTELYYRKLDRHGWLNNSTRLHVAISYVWAEWTDEPTDRLPDWNAIRQRLLSILGEGASKSIRSETGNATRCWLDSKCIDQSSAGSKSYWIPRMDEIYAEARCTILLLRDPSIAVLVPVAQRMTCNVKTKTTIFDWPHSCLLSQSCSTLPEMSIDQEIACIKALRVLYDGTWRKRAWIFQEILLSKRLLLSIRDSEFIGFSDIGVIANLLFQRHLNEAWLRAFSDWCRRILYMRYFYTESQFHHLSDANILQMAAGLQASIPADKIYAICSILRLKGIPYNSSHTLDEAFQVVVNELVKRGRLSWLYAVLPSLNTRNFFLDAANMAPFVLTRLSDRLVTNRNKMHFSKDSVGLPVNCIGQVIQTKPLSEVLKEASDWMKSDLVELAPELEYLLFVPKLIRRIALDVVNPLLVEPLFSQICHGLDIHTQAVETRPTRVWRMIVALYTKNLSSGIMIENHIRTQEDRMETLLAWSAAQSLQERLKALQDEFVVIWSRLSRSNEPATLYIGLQTCTVGDYICSVKDDKQLLFAASLPLLIESGEAVNLSSIDAHFRGMIYDLNSVMTIQWRVKILFGHAVMAPLDIQGPLIGDHPYWDKYKDGRHDKYIKTDANGRESLPSLFGKVTNQTGKPMYLNLAYVRI